MKYDWCNMTEEEKRLAVKCEMVLVTHNGTTKDDFINIMKFQQKEIESLELDVDQHITWNEAHTKYRTEQWEQIKQLRGQVAAMREASAKATEILQDMVDVANTCGSAYLYRGDIGRVSEVIKSLSTDAGDYHNFADIETLKLATEQVREIAKVKAGDMVYCITSPYNVTTDEADFGKPKQVYESVVESLTFYRSGGNQIRLNYNGEFIIHYFSISDFGKIVFTTREAAEKALEGGK